MDEVFPNHHIARKKISMMCPGAAKVHHPVRAIRAYGVLCSCCSRDHSDSACDAYHVIVPKCWPNGMLHVLPSRHQGVQVYALAFHGNNENCAYCHSGDPVTKEMTIESVR